LLLPVYTSPAAVAASPPSTQAVSPDGAGLERDAAAAAADCESGVDAEASARRPSLINNEESDESCDGADDTSDSASDATLDDSDSRGVDDADDRDEYVCSELEEFDRACAGDAPRRPTMGGGVGSRASRNGVKFASAVFRLALVILSTSRV
jgi:hypothetical protein